MRLALALVCEDAHVNPEGRLDVQGVLHDLFAPAFPATQDRMVLVLVIEWDQRDHGRFTFRVDLTTPDGKVILTVDGHTDVAPSGVGQPPARTRLVMPLENVVFPSAGAYSLRARVKGHTLEGPLLHLVEGPTSVDHSTTEQ